MYDRKYTYIDIVVINHTIFFSWLCWHENRITVCDALLLRIYRKICQSADGEMETHTTTNLSIAAPCRRGVKVNLMEDILFFSFFYLFLFFFSMSGACSF